MTHGHKNGRPWLVQELEGKVMGKETVTQDKYHKGRQ
jgi:hypothetical protein